MEKNWQISIFRSTQSDKKGASIEAPGTLDTREVNLEIEIMVEVEMKGEGEGEAELFVIYQLFISIRL